MTPLPSLASRFRFNDLLLFGIYLPILIFCMFVREGKLPQHSFYVYLALFALILIWIISSLFKNNVFQIARREKVLTTSLCLFYFLGSLQMIFWWAGSTSDPYGTYKALPLVFINLALFFLLYDTLRSLRTIKIFFNFIFFLTAILALIGLLQDVVPNVWRKSMFFTTKVHYDFFATFLSEDRFAFFSNMIFPYAITTTLWEVVTHYDWKKPFKALSKIFQRPVLFKVIGTLILGITIGWTGSRSGAISIGIAALIIVFGFFFILWKKLPKKIPYYLILLGLTAVVVPLLLKLTGVPLPVRQVYWWYLNIWGILTGQYFDPSFVGRVFVVRDAIPAILEHPFFGLGLGSFKWAFPQYEFINIGKTMWGNAHNEYIELLFETGFAGFTLLLGLPFILAFKRVVKVVKNIKHIEGDVLVVLLGLIGGITTAAVHSYSDFALKFPASTLVFLGLAAALFSIFHLLPDEAKTLPLNSSSLQKTSNLKHSFFVLLALLLLLTNATMFITSSIKFNWSLNSEKAARLNYFKPGPHIDLLKLSLTNKPDDTQEHQALEERINKISPIARTYYLLGLAFLKEGDDLKAIDYFNRALETAPGWDRYLRILIEARLSYLENENPSKKETNEQIKLIQEVIAQKINREETLRTDLKEKLNKRFQEIKNPYIRKRLTEYINAQQQNID